MNKQLMEEVQLLLSSDNINRMQLMQLITPLSNEEQISMMSSFTPEQYKIFIETIFSLEFNQYQYLMSKAQLEYDIYITDPRGYLNEKVKRYKELTEEEKIELINKVDQSRNRLLIREEYGSLMCDALLQHTNLKHSNSTILDSIGVIDFNLEFMSLYIDFLSVNEDMFMERDISELKNSIKKSIYGSSESMLLASYLNELKNGNADSFLVIPIVQSLPSGGIHTSSILIKKEDEKFVISYLDKAMYYDFSLTNGAPKVDRKTDSNFSSRIKNIFYSNQSEKHYKIAVPLMMEFENSTENRARLMYIIDLATSYNGRSIQMNIKSEKNEHLLVQKELINASNRCYWGKEIYDAQMYVKNCYIKCIGASMQQVLGDSFIDLNYQVNQGEAIVKKIPGNSAKTVSINLAELMKYRLIKMGYRKEVTDYIDKIIYLYLKEKEKARKPLEKRAAAIQLANKINDERIPLFKKEKEINFKSRLITNLKDGLLNRISFVNTIASMEDNVLIENTDEIAQVKEIIRLKKDDKHLSNNLYLDETTNEIINNTKKQESHDENLENNTKEKSKQIKDDR